MERATIEVVHKYKGRLCVLRERKKEFSCVCVWPRCVGYNYLRFEFLCFCFCLCLTMLRSVCWSSPEKKNGRKDGEQKTPDDEYQRGLRGHWWCWWYDGGDVDDNQPGGAAERPQPSQGRWPDRTRWGRSRRRRTSGKEVRRSSLAWETSLSEEVSPSAWYLRWRFVWFRVFLHLN